MRCRAVTTHWHHQTKHAGNLHNEAQMRRQQRKVLFPQDASRAGPNRPCSPMLRLFSARKICLHKILALFRYSADHQSSCPCCQWDQGQLNSARPEPDAAQASWPVLPNGAAPSGPVWRQLHAELARPSSWLAAARRPPPPARAGSAPASSPRWTGVFWRVCHLVSA